MRDRLAALRKKLTEERVTTLVMQELPTPRKTHVFVGGSFLNPGDEVAAGRAGGSRFDQTTRQ